MSAVIMALLEITILSAVLYGVILLFKKLLRNHISAVMNYAVWALLILRLIIPATIDSGMHFFIVPDGPKQAAYTAVSNDVPLQSYSPPAEPSTGDTSFENQINNETNNDPVNNQNQIKAWKIDWQMVSIIIWGAGILFSFCFVAALWRRLHVKIKHYGTAAPAHVLELMNKCKSDMGIRADIKVSVQSWLISPALSVSLKPMLLIPEHMTYTADIRQLEFGIRHELTHYLRRDYLINILLIALRCVYWFNPVIYPAFRSMQADMEIACDAHTASGLEDNERTHYIRTMINLGGSGSIQYVLGMGVSNGRKGMEKRVRGMFMKRKTRPLARFAALLLACVMFVVCFTTACRPAQEKVTVAEPGINSLIERMKSNEAEHSVEDFTNESTIIDVVDKIGADNIGTAAISYNSGLLGYPAVVKYIFSDAENGTLPLTSMLFYIIPETQSGYEEQLRDLADKLEAELGRHEPGSEYPDYRWKSDNYSVILSSEGGFTSSGVLATVNLTPFDNVDMPDIFPNIMPGTDIHAVYGSETPAQGLEGLTDDPYLYYLFYTGKDTTVHIDFKAQGNEIKLSRVLYMTLIPDTGYEDIDKSFKSFADSMEDIFGPAASRDDSPVKLNIGDSPQPTSMPNLIMNWPGLDIHAYYDSLHENYYIDILFSGEYFTPGITSAAPAAASVILPEPLPVFSDSEVADSLIAKLQNVKDTDTFGSLTYGATFEDCLDKLESDKLSYASLTANTEMLGYPAVMRCEFSGLGKPLLRSMGFAIYPRGGESSEEIKTDLLKNLDAAFGSHEEGDYGGFGWQENALSVNMLNNYYLASGLWYIAISNISFDRVPVTPDIFPFKLGDDIRTVYAGVKPGGLPEGCFSENTLGCYDEGVNTDMKFETDETGALKLYEVDYSVRLDDMELGESLDFLESAADRLEDALGDPLDRGYLFPQPDENNDGVTILGAVSDGLGPQDVLDSGCDQYQLIINWEGIYFEAMYFGDYANIYVYCS